MIGSNREFIESYIPHIGTLLRDDIRNVLGHADVVVLGTNSVAVEELRKRLHDDQHLIELNNLTSPLPKEAGVAAGA